MKTKAILCLLSASFLFLASCASNSPTKAYFKEFSGPSIKQLGIKSINPSEVMIRNVPSDVLGSKKRVKEFKASLSAKNLVQLGVSEYRREGQTRMGLS